MVLSVDLQFQYDIMYLYVKRTINKNETKGTKMKVSGNTMNKVYTELKTMTVEQIKQCKDQAYTALKGYHQEVFQIQCDYAIEKKLAGKW